MWIWCGTFGSRRWTNKVRIAIKTGVKDRVIVNFLREKVDIWKKMCNFAPKKCITMVDVVSIASYISERCSN